MARNAYFQQVFASQALGGAAGRTLTLAISGWAALNTVRVAVVTTATAGSRNMKLRVLDNGGVNVLFEFIDPNALTASQTWGLNWASGVAVASSGQTHVMPLPSELPIPLGAQLNIFDIANVDVNDTVQLTAIMTIA